MPPPKAMRSVTHVMSMRQSAPLAELSAAAGTPLAILQGVVANEFYAAGNLAIQAGGCESARERRFFRQPVKPPCPVRALRPIGDRVPVSLGMLPPYCPAAASVQASERARSRWPAAQPEYRSA